MIIIGNGGLAKEASALARQNGSFPSGRIGPDDEDKLLQKKIITKLVLAIGNPHIKKKVAQKFAEYLESFESLISRTANFLGRHQLGKGCLVLPGAVVSTDAEIGDFVLVNYNATIGHDVTIGNHCSIMPGANISGYCKIKENALIGANAFILQGVTVGKNSIVGAGSVVLKDVPDNVVCVGNPAKMVKCTSE